MTLAFCSNLLYIIIGSEYSVTVHYYCVTLTQFSAELFYISQYTIFVFFFKFLSTFKRVDTVFGSSRPSSSPSRKNPAERTNGQRKI